MKILILPFLFISIVTAAQKKDSALLQSFKFRTPNYRAVSLSGNAAGSYGSAYTGKSDYSFAISPLFVATKLISTDKKYSTYNYEVSGNINFYKRETIASGSVKQADIASAVRLYGQTKRYNGQNFITTGYAATLQQSYYKANNSNINNRSEIFSTVGYTIGTGKGRIENVTDAQMAYNILSDLKKNNLLTNDFTTDDAYSLAQTITMVNNTRLFDFRRKRIFELKQIDSLLHSKGLIDKNSIDYFTTVADNWFYAFNEQRRHGTEKYILLTPYLNLTNGKTDFNVMPDSIVKNFSRGASVFLTAGIEKAVAKSIKRQFTKGISLQHALGYGKNKTTGNTYLSETETRSLTGFLNAFLQWGYYPNTRTIINTMLNNILAWDYKNSNLNNNTSFTFNGNYFINYNTRVVVNVSTGLNVAKNSVSNFNTAFASSFNIGLQHFIR